MTQQQGEVVLRNLRVQWEPSSDASPPHLRVSWRWLLRNAASSNPSSVFSWNRTRQQRKLALERFSIYAIYPMVRESQDTSSSSDTLLRVISNKHSVVHSETAPIFAKFASPTTRLSQCVTRNFKLSAPHNSTQICLHLFPQQHSSSASASLSTGDSVSLSKLLFCAPIPSSFGSMLLNTRDLRNKASSHHTSAPAPPASNHLALIGSSSGILFAVALVLLLLALVRYSRRRQQRHTKKQSNMAMSSAGGTATLLANHSVQPHPNMVNTTATGIASITRNITTSTTSKFKSGTTELARGDTCLVKSNHHSHVTGASYTCDGIAADIDRCVLLGGQQSRHPQTLEKHREEDEELETAEEDEVNEAVEEAADAPLCPRATPASAQHHHHQHQHSTQSCMARGFGSKKKSKKKKKKPQEQLQQNSADGHHHNHHSQDNHHHHHHHHNQNHHYNYHHNKHDDDDADGDRRERDGCARRGCAPAPSDSAWSGASSSQIIMEGLAWTPENSSLLSSSAFAAPPILNNSHNTNYSNDDHDKSEVPNLTNLQPTSQSAVPIPKTLKPVATTDAKSRERINVVASPLPASSPPLMLESAKQVRQSTLSIARATTSLLLSASSSTPSARISVMPKPLKISTQKPNKSLHLKYVSSCSAKDALIESPFAKFSCSNSHSPSSPPSLHTSARVVSESGPVISVGAPSLPLPSILLSMTSCCSESSTSSTMISSGGAVITTPIVVSCVDPLSSYSAVNINLKKPSQSETAAISSKLTSCSSRIIVQLVESV